MRFPYLSQRVRTKEFCLKNGNIVLCNDDKVAIHNAQNQPMGWTNSAKLTNKSKPHFIFKRGMDIFGENEWVVLSVPSGGERLVQLKSSEFIELGRFGRFPAQHLLGAKSGSYFSIQSDGSLVQSTASQVSGEGGTSDASGLTAAEITNTNQTLLDTNTSQRLSTADVEALKDQVDRGALEASEVVRTLIQNSETFEGKNAFSQIKYVQRKQKKFLKWFTARKVTIRTLTSYFMKRDPRKIMY